MLEVVEIEKEVKLFSKHVKTFSTLSLTPSVVRSFRYKKLEDVDFLFMRKASDRIGESERKRERESESAESVEQPLNWWGRRCLPNRPLVAQLSLSLSLSPY